MSKYTPAQAEAIKRYRKKNEYIELRCRVTKDERENIKNHAESKGESINKFINRAINETMKRDKEENIIESTAVPVKDTAKPETLQKEVEKNNIEEAVSIENKSELEKPICRGLIDWELATEMLKKDKEENNVEEIVSTKNNTESKIPADWDNLSFEDAIKMLSWDIPEIK